MAPNTSDEMDEFFDFAALNQDDLPDALSDSQLLQIDADHSTDDVVAMDWAMDWTTDSLTVRPTDVVLPYEMQTYDTSIGFHTTQESQLWPLNDHATVSLAPKGHEGVVPTSNSIWQKGSHAPDNDQIYIGSHTSPPPFSSSFAHKPSKVVADNDDEGSIDVLGAPLESVPFLVLPGSEALRLEIPQTVSPPKPSGSLRQAPNASWKPASAKRKGPQSRIPFEAKQILEDEFAANPYPLPWEMDIIAHQANLDVKKVRNWFNNTRARKKGGDSQPIIHEAPDNDANFLKTKLSINSLETLNKQADGITQPPQPPLAVYLAQSYQEEAVELSAVQAAIDDSSFTGTSQDDAWSDSWQGRRGSVMTSVASSEGTAPTTYTVSSSGSRSNISSFGRDRRRGRRRMAWKESPRQAINGVNSAGEPQKDLPFFCTFCPRAFKTKYEWVRHEDSVHALRTTWICCDTKPSATLVACPFCGQAHPDDDHMAGHKYQQCRSKPESQRTFYRRDHFVQHLHHVHFANAKHPSVRVGCQARLLAADGHNFGCKDLAMKWRRFGAPMKLDDPMLHCGFCGKKSKDWSERCEHVAEHLIARELDRALWWNERKENHLGNLYSASPYESFRCRYCQKVFTDVKEMNEHSHCRVWSCRFLRSFDDVAADNAGPPLCPDFPSAKAHHCHLCGAGYRTFHVEHAQNYHRYRSCNQEFYTSEETFLQHLHNFHGASQPALLRGNGAIEQSYMRNKGASFEPVEFNESWQPCIMDLDVASVSPFVADNTIPAPPTSQLKDQAHAKKQSPAKKGQQRCRSKTTISKGETHSPRFFRLSTYIPFRSSRIFYSHNAKTVGLPRDNQAVLEEVPMPHITSLVMSAGLVSMAAARWVIRPETQMANGMVELTLGDERDAD